MYLFYNVALPFAVMAGLGFSVFNKKLRLSDKREILLTAAAVTISVILDKAVTILHATVLLSEPFLIALIFIYYHLVFHPSVYETALPFSFLRAMCILFLFSAISLQAHCPHPSQPSVPAAAFFYAMRLCWQ